MFANFTKYWQWRIQAVWEPGIPVWAPKLWCPNKVLTFHLKIFLNIHREECFVIQFAYLENVLQRNLRTGMARECIFRASGGTRFKNFRQPWWQKGGGGTCNQSVPKNSRYVTDWQILLSVLWIMIAWVSLISVVSLFYKALPSFILYFNHL